VIETTILPTRCSMPSSETELKIRRLALRRLILDAHGRHEEAQALVEQIDWLTVMSKLESNL